MKRPFKHFGPPAACGARDPKCPFTTVRKEISCGRCLKFLALLDGKRPIVKALPSRKRGFRRHIHDDG